jgi:mannose-6-phosphate isomerase-like protein (cupin superfamily)
LKSFDNADCIIGDPETRPQNFRKIDFKPRAGRLDLIARPDGYCGQLVHQGNLSVVIASTVPPRTFGVPVHRHHVDQIFLSLEGEVTIGVEGVDHTVAAGGLIVVPKGTPHTSRNAGDVQTLYLEVLTPAPIFFSGLLVKEGSDVERDPNRPVIVVRPQDLKEMMPDDVAAGESLLGQRLISPQTGCKDAIINHVRSTGRTNGPDLHAHTFDQFFYVAEGELTVRILFEKYRVPKGTLVVIPAGTPHTQFNESDTPTRYFSILTPPFRQGETPAQTLAVGKL